MLILEITVKKKHQKNAGPFQHKFYFTFVYTYSIKQIKSLSIQNYITILCNALFLISVKGLSKQNNSYNPYFN